MERLSRSQCLQEKTGSCAGCPMQNQAAEQLKRVGSIDIRSLSKQLCPEGNTMQMPRIQKRSIW